MQGINPLTMKCTYITPCGWCTRQNKECDIEETKKRNKKYGDLFKSPTITNELCQSDEDHQWECCGISTAGSTYRCKVCGEHKSVPITSSESSTISVHLNDQTYSPCDECAHEGWDMPQCKECNASNDFKYFERKKDTK